MAAGTENVRARVESSTLEQLRAIADANDRTLSQEIRRALRMYVAAVRGRTTVQDQAAGSSSIVLEPTPGA